MDSQTEKVAPKRSPTHVSDQMQQCFEIIESTPCEPARRFQSAYRHPVGGMARHPYSLDPRCPSLQLAHGLQIESSGTAAETLLPSPKTFYQDALENELNERYYPNRKRNVVGHAPESNIPIDRINSTFGSPTRRGDSMGVVLFPPTSPEEHKRSFEPSYPSHSKVTGEVGTISVSRNYNKNFNPMACFGSVSELCKSNLKESQRILNRTDPNLSTSFVPQKLQDFNDRTKAKLGQCQSLGVNPMRYDLNMVYGDRHARTESVDAAMKPELFEKNENRNYIAETLQKLEDNSFYQFDELYECCRRFDRTNSGWITFRNLKEACDNMGLPMRTHELKKLLRVANLISSQKTINIADFIEVIDFNSAIINMMNETDDAKEDLGPQSPEIVEVPPTPSKTSIEQKLHMTLEEKLREYSPEGPYFRKIDEHDIENHVQDFQDGSFQRVPDMTTHLDIVIEKKPQHSCKCIDFETAKCNEILNHADRWSSEMSNIGLYAFMDTRGWCTMGKPTIRTNHPPPRAGLQRLEDYSNYGDGVTAYSLLNPSIYSNQGITKEDMLLPRTKAEVWRVYSKAGVSIDDCIFDKIWEEAVLNSPDNIVSFESFRNILDEIISNKSLT